MREVIEDLLSESAVVDFEENILLASVRATTRLWQENGKVVGFSDKLGGTISCPFDMTKNRFSSHPFNSCNWRILRARNWLLYRLY